MKGERLKKELEGIMKQSKIIGDIRGKGLLLGVEFVSDKKAKHHFPLQWSCQRELFRSERRGLLIYPAQAGIDGGEGDAVIIAPPLTVSEAEMKELVQIFRDSVHMVEKQAEKVMRADDAFE